MLCGRNALVTGATGALGQAIARQLWEHGANVLLVGRSPQRVEHVRAALPPRAGQASGAIVEDLADPGAPERIVSKGRELMPQLHVLVNNAADQGPIGPAWDNDWAEWQRALQIDLFAPVALCRLAVGWMQSPNGARRKIVNLSGGGATGPRPRFSAYATAKAGLVRFAETLAEETRELGIDVNCVAPGVMKSGMTEAVLRAGPGGAGAKEYGTARRVVDQGATSTERAAALCVFLASPASDGITGKLVSAVWDRWEALGEHLEDLRATDVYTLRRIVPADRQLGWGDES